MSRSAGPVGPVGPSMDPASAPKGWKPLGRPVRPAGATPFSRLAHTHILATAGDTLVTLALADSVFFSISPNAARERVALYLLLTMAPFVVVAPLLGPALDRSRGGRRTMMFAAAASRALVCFSMAGHLQGLLLFPEAFAVLVLSKAHMVTKSALVPATVSGEGEGELVSANSRLALVSVVAGFAAAVPGFIILKIGSLGAPWVVRLAAVAFAAAALAALRLPRPPEHKAPPPADREEAELHGATVRLSSTAMAVLRASVGFLTFLVAFAFRREGAPAWWFGVALATSMVGTFVGNAVAPRLRKFLPEERIILGSLLLVAVVSLAAAQVGGRTFVAIVAAALGFGAGAGKLAFDSIIQRDAPDAVRGRTFARFETRFQLAWVLGAAIPVVIPVPARAGMVVLALASAAAFTAYVAGVSAVHRRA